MPKTAIDEKLSLFTNSTIAYLATVILAGLAIRLYFFPYDIPITFDGLLYFRYATDTAILGHFPLGFDFPNNGWPSVVAVFFSLIHSNNFLDYMFVQRVLTVIISVLTVIPVYLLCNRFVEKPYALIGATIFAFEPRIIMNSLSGLAEPLYILLATISVFLFLSDNKKITYISFAVVALCTQVRYEGIVLFFALSIMFFVRFRRENSVVQRYLMAALIFILVLLPLSYIRIQTIGYDGIFSALVGGVQVYSDEATSYSGSVSSSTISYIGVGFVQTVKFLGWVMIPIFVFFVPFGSVLILKNRDDRKWTVVVCILALILPALYAYSRGIQETKYLYVLYPLFCVLAVLAFKRYMRLKRPHLVLCLVTFGIVGISVGFIAYKDFDYEHEREALKVAERVVSLTEVINEYYPESRYIRVIAMKDAFPVLSTEVSYGPKLVPTDSASLVEFIQRYRTEGLDHIFVDGARNRAAFLNQVFEDDLRYPYLIKVFDSSDIGLKYHVKIYKIDYEKFDSMKN
jgi:hypothetical protein